jgi:hypothetical protein
MVLLALTTNILYVMNMVHNQHPAYRSIVVQVVRSKQSQLYKVATNISGTERRGGKASTPSTQHLEHINGPNANTASFNKPPPCPPPNSSTGFPHSANS